MSFLLRRAGSLRSSNRGLAAGSSNKKDKQKDNSKQPDDEDSDWVSEPVTLRLGNCNLVYDNGEWRGAVEAGGKKPVESDKDKDKDALIRKLEEENRLLKFKIEVLIDMMALDRAKSKHN